LTLVFLCLFWVNVGLDTDLEMRKEKKKKKKTLKIIGSVKNRPSHKKDREVL